MPMRTGKSGAPEPDVECDGKLTPISAVFGRMRGCTDILPIRVFDDVQAVVDEPSLAQFSGKSGDIRGSCSRTARPLR